ncbi:hypothetical protein QBC38DRAFT_374972, partial [Podospora fimiseda]
DYFGNSVALPVTQPATLLPTAAALAASCDDAQTILAIAREITNANKSVNEEFVKRRTELFCSVPDIRYLGINLDSNQPGNFSMNTWAFLGSNTQWNFPELVGGSGGAPDAIRRVQGQWAGSCHGLILPSRPGIPKGRMELVITLPVDAMSVLERDADWMHFVEQVSV